MNNKDWGLEGQSKISLLKMRNTDTNHRATYKAKDSAPGLCAENWSGEHYI